MPFTLSGLQMEPEGPGAVLKVQSALPLISFCNEIFRVSIESFVFTVSFRARTGVDDEEEVEDEDESLTSIKVLWVVGVSGLSFGLAAFCSSWSERTSSFVLLTNCSISVVEDVGMNLALSCARSPGLGEAGLILLSSGLLVFKLLAIFLGCSLGDWMGEAFAFLRTGLSALACFGESCSCALPLLLMLRPLSLGAVLILCVLSWSLSLLLDRGESEVLLSDFGPNALRDGLVGLLWTVLGSRKVKTFSLSLSLVVSDVEAFTTDLPLLKLEGFDSTEVGWDGDCVLDFPETGEAFVCSLAVLS